MTTPKRIETTTTELADELAALHNAARGCVFDLAPRDGPIARLALFMHENGNRVIAALTGAGYAAGIEEWNDASVIPPNDCPVFAEHRAWNEPDGETMQHVVWWFGGEWRPFPHTEDRAYVDRWRALALPQPAPAEDALQAAWEAADAFIRSHVADPDITPEMIETYSRYRAARQALTGTKGDGG